MAQGKGKEEYKMVEGSKMKRDKEIQRSEYEFTCHYVVSKSVCINNEL